MRNPSYLTPFQNFLVITMNYSHLINDRLLRISEFPPDTISLGAQCAKLEIFDKTLNFKTVGNMTRAYMLDNAMESRKYCNVILIE